MSSNQDIAYRIFKRLKELQEEQIINNSIKESDIIDFSEESFIEELNINVSQYISKIGDTSVIDEVYKNILVQTNKAQSINEFFSEKGISIPEKMIKDAVENVTKNQQSNSVKREDSLLENVVEQNLFNNFMKIDSIDKKMEYYQALNEEEKREVRSELYSQIFGKEISEQIINIETILTDIQNSNVYESLSEDRKEQLSIDLSLYNPMKYVLEELGLPDDYLQKPNDIVELSTALSHISKGSFGDAEVVLKKFFGEDCDISEKISEIQGKLQEDGSFDINLKKMNKIISRNNEHVLEYEFQFRNKIKKILPELSAEIDEINSTDFANLFVMAFSEDGELNIDLAAKFLTDGIRQKGADMTLDELWSTVDEHSEEFEELHINYPSLDTTKDYTHQESLQGTEDLLSIFSDTGLDFMCDALGLESGGIIASYGEVETKLPEDYLPQEAQLYYGIESVEQPLPEEVSAELNAIPVALQRINCQPEDIAKGMEAYKQVIETLTPEEIDAEPAMLAETLKKAVDERGLEGIAGDILKMMSQINFNGQITEILKNSKLEFLNMLETISLQGPLMDPRVFAVNPEQYSANPAGSAPTERIDDETLKVGFAALAVDLQIADQTIIRTEELVSDNVNLRREDAEIDSSRDEQNGEIIDSVTPESEAPENDANASSNSVKITNVMNMAKKIRPTTDIMQEMGNVVAMNLKEQEGPQVEDPTVQADEKE